MGWEGGGVFARFPLEQSGIASGKKTSWGEKERECGGFLLQCFLLNCSSHTDVVSSQDFLNFGDLCDTLVSSVPQQVKPKFSKRTSDALTLTGSR